MEEKHRVAYFLEILVFLVTFEPVVCSGSDNQEYIQQ